LLVYDAAGYAVPVEILTPATLVQDGMQLYVPDGNASFAPNLEYIKWQMCVDCFLKFSSYKLMAH